MRQIWITANQREALAEALGNCSIEELAQQDTVAGDVAREVIMEVLHAVANGEDVEFFHRDKQISIPQAAAMLGTDSITVTEMINQGKLASLESSSDHVVVLAGDVHDVIVAREEAKRKAFETMRDLERGYDIK